MKLIVDGYNLIHAEPHLRAAMEKGLEVAREELVRRLVAYTGSRKVAVTVVFDGQAGTGSALKGRGRVQVLFTRPPETADERIVTLIALGPKEVTVVSSDGRVAKEARARGAKVISSGSFGPRLFRSVTLEDSREEKPEGITPHEAEEWLKIFSRRKE